ncbi:MAG: hypothetical protein ABSF84_16950 [Acidimicrobiales bacterium]
MTALTRVSRRTAHQSDGARHVSHLCDDCLEDLRSGRPTAGTDTGATHPGRRLAHWREVA